MGFTDGYWYVTAVDGRAITRCHYSLVGGYLLRIRGFSVPFGDNTVFVTVDTPADCGMGGYMQ